MYFRFASAIALVVAISLAGVALEKKNLDLRREVSRQHYRTEVLQDRLARLRLRAQQLGAPVRSVESLESGALQLTRPEKPIPRQANRMPLLRWQRIDPHD
jgi:hypothetical protein